MTVSVASSADCADVALTALNLDQSGLDLSTPEALAASLRRAASFLCPTTPRQLVDAVMEVLQPLRPGDPLERDDLMDLVELLVSAGDLVELPPAPERRGRRLYLGPPSFVEKRPGRYLLLGIRPFGAPLVDGGTASNIRYERHTRTIELDPGRAAADLRSLGVHPIAREAWVGTPAREPALDLIATVSTRLDAASAAGSIAGLTIIDPAAPLRFYRSRWRSVRPDDSGDFVARRSQEYGADLWCYVRISGGVATRLIDFPLDDPILPGRDEAWRLQAAIDAACGRRHEFRVVPSQTKLEYSLINFRAPVPTWAERYLELIGTAVSEPRNALFSYLIPNDAVPDLIGFLGEMLWMRAAGTGGTR